MSAHAHGSTTATRTASRPTPTAASSAIALALILGFMLVEVVAGLVGELARAALGRGPHAHRRGRDRVLAGRHPARGAPGAGRHDLRPQARRDPLGAGQRRHAAGARAADPRSRPSAGCSIRRTSRAASCSPSPSSASPSTSPRRGRSPSANRTSLNVEGSFQHILTDLYAFIAPRSRARRALDGLAARRPARLAARRRADAARRLRAPARLGPDLPRGRAGAASIPTRSAARSSRSRA